VKPRVFEAIAQKVSQLVPFVVSVANDSFKDSLALQAFSIFHREGADLHKKVVYGSVICNSFHVFNKVNLKDVDN